MRRLRHIKKTITFAAVAVVLIAILISQITLVDIINALTGIKLYHILMAFFLYVLSYLFRSLRFALLLNKKVSLKSMFKITCLHNMFNNILPARTGELSYIHLVKRWHNISLGEGVASLTFARILDFCTVVFLFLLSAIVVRGMPSVVFFTITIVIIAALTALSLLTLLVYYKRRFLQFTESIARILCVEKTRMWTYLMTKMNEILESLTLINSKRYIFLGFLYSLLLWGCLYLVSWILLVKAMGLDLTLAELVVASTFVLLTTILPIQGLAGYGTSEGAWTLVAMPFGILKTEAISSGLCSHTIQIVFFILLGIVGLFLRDGRR